MRSPPRKRFPIFTCAVLLLLGAIAYWAYNASQAAPEFYRQALAVDREIQVVASDEMLHQATALYNDVQKVGDWEAVFTTDQINGWLAVDMQENHPDLLPKYVYEPRVFIDETGMKLGCRYESKRISTVFSLEMDTYLAEENVIAMRIRNAKAGALPLPLDKVLDGVAEGAQRLKLKIEWQTIENDPVAMITVAPPRSSEDLKVTVTHLQLRDGEIYVAGTTNAANRARLDAAFSPSKFIRSK
ncbi:MAG: hypothetical protein MPJ50_16515 [Pirellulales bacterium]|nr:hypothetical protein [Pirellulales bacterium]